MLTKRKKEDKNIYNAKYEGIKSSDKTVLAMTEFYNKIQLIDLVVKGLARSSLYANTQLRAHRRAEKKKKKIRNNKNLKKKWKTKSRCGFL